MSMSLFNWGFCKLHSTDSGSLFILILLELSAVDTVDHNLLLARLEFVFGVSDTALSWFRCYLSDRKQFVAMGGFRSAIGVVHSGVPQGSIPGPILFNIRLYSWPTFKITWTQFSLLYR